jgi:hypothetical protein
VRDSEDFTAGAVVPGGTVRMILPRRTSTSLLPGLAFPKACTPEPLTPAAGLGFRVTIGPASFS